MAPLKFIPIVAGTVFSFSAGIPSYGACQAGGSVRAHPQVREENFSYYQDGHPGRGRRHVMTVTLGDAVMHLIRIPAGKFRMGSDTSEKDRLPDENRHNVELTRDFYFGEYEVTRGQFRAFAKETGYRTEAETDNHGGWGFNDSTKTIEGRKPGFTWKFAGFPETDDYPVVNVTWNDAEAFCRWLSKKIGKPARLPTEAEWEYVARAGSVARYYAGDNAEQLSIVGNVADATAKKQFPDWGSTIAATDGYVFAAPVGRFLANRFGVYDLHGNVWEWCQDWYGPYGTVSVTDPMQNNPIPDASGKTYRVMRGGSWGKRTPRNPTLTRRVGGAPGSRDIDLGFRVVVEVDR